MNIKEAIERAIMEEGRLVTIESFTGSYNGRWSTDALRVNGCREDIQRVLALSASILADTAHNCELPWEEAQLDLLSDLQDLMVHHIMSVDMDDEPMSVILYNVPFTQE